MAFLVSALNWVSNHACDLFFLPFRKSPALVPLAVSAFLTGIAILFVYKFTSNQKAIRRAKDRMQAHVLAVRLFQDQLGVVLRSYGRILGAIFVYLRLSLAPLAVMLVPLALLLVQLDARIAYRPPRAGERLLLTVRAKTVDAVDRMEIVLPREVALTAPLLRDEQEREVVARIEPQQAGACTIRVKVTGDEYTKELVAGEELGNVSAVRVGTDVWERFLHPAEAPLPASAPIAEIALNYPERRISLWGFGLNWIVMFFVLSLVAGFAMKRPLRVEF